MNNKIYEKIDEIFLGRETEEYLKLKKEITFDCKKLYNQMVQSGFSEYIAVAENLDNLNKIEEIVKTQKTVEQIKNKLSKEEKLKDDIKSTTSKEKLNGEYDKEYIDNIKKIVEGAALDTENLDNIDIREQNDEIIYKKNIDNIENIKNNFNNKLTDDSLENNLHILSSSTKKNKSNQNAGYNKKRYFIRLGTFSGIIGLTTLVVYLLHVFQVF